MVLLLVELFFALNSNASEIILVQELKLGIVVLVNTAEEASPIAVAISEIVIPTFQQVLESLQSQVNNLSPNYESYVGSYASNHQIARYLTLKIHLKLATMHRFLNSKYLQSILS